MPDERHGLNIIQVRDEELLLTCTAGDAIHLTGEVASGAVGRGAVLDDVLQDSGDEYPGQRDSYEKLKISYDIAELGEPRWAERTLCGREWIVMARGDGPPLDMYEPEAHAPTCHRCLSLMDRFFPEPKLDERFPMVAQVITDLVLEHGYAEIRGVPGDQQEALRSNVRSAVRRRAGCGSETFAHGDLVVFVCEPIHNLRAEEHQQAAREAMERFYNGDTTPFEDPLWRIWWDTWAAG